MTTSGIPSRLLALALIVAVPSWASAAPPDGRYRVTFRGAAALSPLPSVIFACDEIGGLTFCYSIRPRVDARGRVSGTIEVTVDGVVGGTLVSGDLAAELAGVIKGKTGDGVAPSSKLKLVIRAEGALTAGGEEREASLKLKLQGLMDHAATLHTLSSSRVLKIDGVGVHKGSSEFPFDAMVDSGWDLELDLAAPDGANVTGTATPVFRDDELGEFAVRGKYSSKKQTSKLTLKPDAALKGATIKITNLDLSPVGAASFDVKYGLLGHKGRASSTGANAEWTLVPEGFPSEGTLESPIDIGDMLPYEGTVGPAAPSYYVVHGLAPETVYTVVLARLEGLADVEVRSATGGGSLVCGRLDDTPGVAIECASRSDAAGVLAFQALDHGDDIGGRFELTIAEGGEVDEGTEDAPVDIASFPFEGTALLQSHYRAVGLVPGAPYELSFSDATADVASLVFDAPGFAGVDQICTLTDAGEVCALNANASGEIFILVAVQGAATGARYTLHLAEGGIPNEGSVDKPVDLTGLPSYEGSVGDERSYYAMGGLTPGAPYTVVLRRVSDSISVRLYGEGWHFPIPREDCFSRNVREPTRVECVGKADRDGALRLVVDGVETQAGATYTIQEPVAGGSPNEGYFGTPLDVTGALPRASTVYNTRSVYVVRGLDGSRSYTVILSSLSDNVDLVVYEDAALQVIRCSSSNLDTENEVCAAGSGATELFIWVSGASDALAGATFTLSVDGRGR